MQILSLFVGTALLLVAVYLTFGWRDKAEYIQKWYNYISEPDGRPQDGTQAIMVAWVFILVVAALGAMFVLWGLGSGVEYSAY
jgi:tryptophan-rich sensory protein